MAPSARSDPQTVKPASVASSASGPMPVPDIPEKYTFMLQL